MELWDVYDEQRRLLGKTHVRGVPMASGEYHLVVFVWVFDGRGRVLMTRRSPEKRSYPNKWEHTGGAALAGESSLQAIQRELFEETGIRAETAEFHLVETYCRRGDNDICDIYFLVKDVPLEALTMQPGETCEAKWVNRQELEEMISEGVVARPDVRRYRQLNSKLDKYLR